MAENENERTKEKKFYVFHTSAFEFEQRMRETNGRNREQLQHCIHFITWYL